MNLLELAAVAWGALRQNAVRSSLTMLGVIIGVSAVITSMAIGTGARAAVAAQLARLGSNLIVVVPGSITSGGVSLGLGARQSLKPADAPAVARQVPAVSAVAPQANTSGQVVAETPTGRRRSSGQHPIGPSLRIGTWHKGASSPRRKSARPPR